MQYRIEKLHADTSHAAQHAAGEALARDMLAAACDVSSESILFRRAETGKPYTTLPMQLSISHSDDRILCAIHPSPVGADIQKLVPLPLKVLQRICTPKEQTYIGKDPIRFTEVWTRKEAYAKLIGKGLSLGLKNVIVADENGLLQDVNGYHVLTAAKEDFVFSVVWEDADHKAE